MAVRIGLAVIISSGAFGQALIEFETRVKLQMDTGQPAMPAQEKVLRRERISSRGGMVRMDSGDQFLLFDVAKQNVVLVNTADKSYVRATSEEFAQPLKSRRAIVDKRMTGMNSVEMLEAPAAPPFVWQGKETTAASCRFKLTTKIPSPLAKDPVVSETTIFIYSVRLQEPVGEMQTARQRLQLDLSAEPGGVQGLGPEGKAEIVKCFPRDRLLVRTVTRMESKIMPMRIVAESVYDALRIEEGPLAADLFVVPEGWTEEPASSLERRVLQYLQGPAAIQ